MKIRVNSFRHPILGFVLMVGVSMSTVQAQDKSPAGDKRPPLAGAKLEKSIPTFRVSPRPTELSALEGTPSRRFATGDARPLVPPPALTTDARRRLLRDSGISVGAASAPREFRLSPQKPYVSSSAYLFFNGGIEFNAADDSLVMKVVAPAITFPDWRGIGGGFTPPEVSSILGVLIRMDAGGRYLADFSLTSDVGITYELSVTGADGAGTFSREAGAHHVFAVLEASAAGYVRLNLWGRRSPTLSGTTSTFTFHNVVVSKLN